MRILIVKLSALGDIVQTLPVLTLFKKANPFLEIDWVVDKRNAEILVDHPFLKSVIIFSKEYLKSPFKLKNFLKSLRKVSYDAVIDYQGLFKSGIITRFAKGNYKIGFSNYREGSSFFYNFKLPPYDPDLHATKRYILLTKEVLKIFGLDEVVSDEEFKKIPEVYFSKKLLKKKDFSYRPYLLFIPSARWETKLWSFSQWEELLKLISDVGKKFNILISGSPGEKELKIWAENMEKKFPFVFSLVGKISLKDLVSLINQARLVVSVDTGPMHIASALKKKTVALFGPTSPKRTGPWGGTFKVIQKNLPCVPCFKKKCNIKECMKKITPEEVKEAIKNFLT